MATIEELHAALLKADAAGDATSAKELADHIRMVSAPAQQPQLQPQAPQPTGALANAWDGAKNLGLGLYRGVMDPIDGGAQLAAHGAATAAHWAAPGSAVDKFFGDQAQGVDAINTNREDAYQSLTPGSIAAGVGRVGGNIVVPLKSTSVARSAGLLAKSGGAVRAGAIVGATQPVFNAGQPDLSSLTTGQQPVDYWNEKARQVGIGAATGGAMSAAGSALAGTYNALRPLISPSSTAGNTILNGLSKASQDAVDNIGMGDGNISTLAGSYAPLQVVARLQAAKPLVPGSLPTTAQVAGVPELVMAEKALKNNPAYRGAFEDRSIANNKARLAEIQRVARTPGDLLRATDARESETAPLYAAARNSTLPLDPELQDLFARPSMQQAITRAGKLAAERGEPPFAIPPPGAEMPGTIDGGMLQYIKMGLDDLQKVSDAKGIGAHEGNALHNTQDSLKTWISLNSPEYALADKAYANASRPINSMQAGQSIYNSLTDGVLNAAGDVAPALSQFRTQYAKALKSSPYGLTPETTAALDAVQSDLQRETISNSIRSAGSDTYFNSQAPNWLSGKLFGDDLDGKSMLGQGAAGLVGLVSGGPMAAAGGVAVSRKLGQFVGNRVNDQFQRAMLEPDYFQTLLKGAIDRQSAGGVTNYLVPVGQRAAAVSTTNALANP